MEIGDWSACEDLNEIYREIRALGLEANVAELEAFGFTVIKDALPADLTRQLRDAVVRVAEEDRKAPLDVETEQQLTDVQIAYFLLFRDPVFEAAVLNPKPLALISYLLGKHCYLSTLSSHVKGPGGRGVLIHADSANGLPAPFAAYSHGANCNYALTDYTEEKGALAIVPASHHKFRQPTRWENKVAGKERNPEAIPVEVPAGSAIIWKGATWHGSFPRRVPGLRINLALFYSRQYMATLEAYRDCVPESVLARHGRDSRMAQLLGLNTFAGWRGAGPKPELAKLNHQVGTTWHS